MQQRGRSGQPAKGRRANRPKARKGSTAAPSIADLQRQVGTLTRELKQANERQTASAEVLRVINSSPGDLAPVFDAILEKAHRLCGVSQGSLQLYDGEKFRAVAVHGLSEAFADRLRRGFRLGPNSPGQRLLDGARFVQIPDLGEIDDPMSRAAFELAGVRTILFIPLRKDGTFFGRISASRPEVKPFTEMEIVLLESFAAQAVIAIENARLFEEVQAKTCDLTEALTYQTGSANILKVIASSPTDVGPVLTAIVESACVICEAENAHVTLKDGDELVFQAQHGSAPVVWKRQPINRRWVTGRAAVDRRSIHVHDLLSSEGDQFPDGQELARRDGARTMLAVPLLREGECVGVIVLRRMEVRPFSEKQIELLQTFADQAVIAIGNVRLFGEVQAKTRDLEESLQQQTATSEVLQIISSSPGDLAPVFDKMLENATRVCGAEFGSMNLVEDGLVRQAALHNAPPAFAAARTNKVSRPHPQSTLANAIRSKQVAHVADLRTNPAYIERAEATVELVELGGARTAAVVPMLRDGEVIGVIAVYRQEVRLFDDKQIELLSNFAKQAVIAIENARLLKELRQSLQQQTATADVLKIISSSSVDLETVLGTLLETVARLCRADQAAMYRQRDDMYHLIASHGLSQEAKQFVVAHPFAPGRGSLNGRVAMERRAVHISDVLQDPEYTHHELQKIVGYRSILGVPLLRGDTLIGIFAINRTRVDPFTPKEIELATTFADQAVIAIENARLFEELRDRQAELRVTFDNMGDGVVMFDTAGRLAAWNRNFQEMLELPDTFLARRPSFAEYFRYLADRGEYVSADLEARLSRTVDDTGLEARYERTRPDGHVIEVRRNPVPGGGFVLIYSDVTKRKRAEEAIRAARY